MVASLAAVHAAASAGDLTRSDFDIVLWGATARWTGVRILRGCAHDFIPSDLGVQILR